MIKKFDEYINESVDNELEIGSIYNHIRSNANFIYIGRKSNLYASYPYVFVVRTSDKGYYVAAFRSIDVFRKSDLSIYDYLVENPQEIMGFLGSLNDELNHPTLKGDIKSILKDMIESLKSDAIIKSYIDAYDLGL